MDGIINILKPPGLTSRQVVSIAKGILKEKKVGHAGTLDPGASGVLPVMLGKATKLFDYMGEGTKEYIAEFKFGVKTTTQDSYGDVIETKKELVTKDMVENVIKSFIGEYEQTPSIFSAVHINGKRAYDYAYAGKDVELPKRKVVIYNTELLAKTDENSYLVKVKCSKGCYIRSFCEDVAKKLSTVGYVSVLIRTVTGMFSIDKSITIDELQDFKPEFLTSLEEVLKNMDSLQVNKELDNALYNGNKLPVSSFKKEINQNTVYRILDSDNQLWALGEKDGDIIRIKQMLRDKL